MSPHHAPPPEQPEVYVGGWSIVRYAQVVKWPAVIAIVLNIIVTTARWDLALTWFFLIVLTVFLGVVTARVYGGTVGNAAGLGLTAGLIVGVATSLFQFLWFHNVAAFFQIVTTSFLSVMVGVLMSTSAFLVLAKEHRPSVRHQQRHKKEQP